MYTDNKFLNKHVYENSPIMFIPIPAYQNEVFVDIVGEDIIEYYMISNYGRIFNKYGNYFLKTELSNSGYERACLMLKEFGSKKYSVHRLVMNAFEPVHDPEKNYVNHINGIKTDNRYSNLEWCTPAYNSNEQFYRHLRQNNSNQAKITEADVHQICKLIQDTDYSARQISEMIGGNCTPDIVSGIMKGSTWKKISKDYKFRPRKPSQVMTENDAHVFCKYFEAHPRMPGVTIGQYCEQACIDLGYTPLYRLVNSLTTIYCKRNWKHIVEQYNF